jgi:3D (Asp-Asp-Asp) domain-containing protein
VPIAVPRWSRGARSQAKCPLLLDLWPRRHTFQNSFMCSTVSLALRSRIGIEFPHVVVSKGDTVVGDYARRYLAASLISAAPCLAVGGMARAEVASIYGGRDGLCGSRTANGERLNCAAMTAAHRTLPFGTLVDVSHKGCVTVRINDRGPFIRGRHIDLSPAAARAIELTTTGHVTISRHAQPPIACNGDCAVKTPTLPKPDRVEWISWMRTIDKPLPQLAPMAPASHGSLTPPSVSRPICSASISFKSEVACRFAAFFISSARANRYQAAISAGSCINSCSSRNRKPSGPNGHDDEAAILIGTVQGGRKATARGRGSAATPMRWRAKSCVVRRRSISWPTRRHWRGPVNRSA